MQPMPVTRQVFVIQIESADGSTWTPIQGHLCRQLTDNQWEVSAILGNSSPSEYKDFLEAACKHDRLICVHMDVLKEDCSGWARACLYGVVRPKPTDFGKSRSIVGRIAWLDGSHDPKAPPQSPLDWESFCAWQRFVIECANYRAALGDHLAEGG